MEPNWLRVIEAWRAQDPTKVGPSFPFLFGATRTPIGQPPLNEQLAQEQFFALLDDIEEYELDGGFFAVRRCRDVSGHFIISPEDAVGTTGGISYFIGRANAADSRTLIWQESREAIIDGRFSVRGGHFLPFNAEELALITRALR